MRIAFVGKAGCGKTTLARLLVNKYGFVRLSFAKSLKDVAAQVLGRPIDKARDRRFLQLFGDGARSSEPNVWINWLAWKLSEAEESGREHIVVDDCRYLNEAEWLRDRGFVVIKVLGGKHEYDLPNGQSEHSSEVEMDEIVADYNLDSTGTIKQAYANLLAIMAKIQKKAKTLDLYHLNLKSRLAELPR